MSMPEGGSGVIMRSQRFSRSIAGEGDCEGITRRFRLFTLAGDMIEEPGQQQVALEVVGRDRQRQLRAGAVRS